MNILGVDPGYARVGWGVIQKDKQHVTPVAYGCIETDKDGTPELRLYSVFLKLREIITRYKPQCVSVEELFFSANVKTAIQVGQARGVVLLAAAGAGIPVASYTPTAVKQTICGTGTADKKQIERMVMIQLKLKNPPTPDDTADALAIALTHAYSYNLKSTYV